MDEWGCPHLIDCSDLDCSPNPLDLDLDLDLDSVVPEPRLRLAAWSTLGGHDECESVIYLPNNQRNKQRVRALASRGRSCTGVTIAAVRGGAKRTLHLFDCVWQLYVCGCGRKYDTRLGSRTYSM